MKSSASADLLIKKKEPDNPEDYMDLPDKVDRDTLAENAGSQESDEPETASLASVPRTKTSSKGHKDLGIGKDNRPIESDEESEAFDQDPLRL